MDWFPFEMSLANTMIQLGVSSVSGKAVMDQPIIAVRELTDLPGKCIDMSRLPEVSFGVVKISSKVVVTSLIFSWLLRYTASLCRTSTPVVYDSRFSRSWPCIASTFGGGRLNRWGNITGNRTASGVVDIRSERNFVETTLFSKLARMKFNKGSAVCLWSTVPVHFNNCFG